MKKKIFRTQKRQKYIVVKQQSYVMHYLFWQEESKMIIDDMPTLTSVIRKIIREEITKVMNDMPAAVEDAICNQYHAK